MRGDEQDYLPDWIDAFGQVHGQPPVLEPFEGPTNTDEVYTLTFPPVFEPMELVGGTGFFRHQPGMAEYVRSLGFDWDDDGHILTAPTPMSMNTLVDAVSPKGAGFRLAYLVIDSDILPLGAWLTLYQSGVLPIHVARKPWYDKVIPSRMDPETGRGVDVGFQVSSVAHDLTVHALNYHLVPHAWLRSASERIAAAMPERAAEWPKPGATAPLTLTFFWDNDFNRYCYQVWCRCEKPQDFERMFYLPVHLEQLEHALDVRIQETMAGKGDVASGDTDDMGPLTQVEYRFP